MLRLDMVAHFFERINNRKMRGYHNTHFAFSNRYYQQNYLDLEDMMNELRRKRYIVKVKDCNSFKQIIVIW